MNKKVIAVIKKNQIVFDRMEEFALPLLYKELDDETRKSLKEKLNDYLWSVIEPYVKFIEIGIEDDFLTIVCENIAGCFPERNLDELFYQTEGSYSSPKKYIELLYCQPMWNEYEANKQENINTVGCYFSLKHTVIENNCVIIGNKYDLTAPQFATIDSVTREDILRIIRRRYFFTAVLVKDDLMVKYYYQDPRFLISKVFGLEKEDNIQKFQFSHLKYNLLFYFQQDESKYVNKIATRINGLYRVHGDILVLHELEENIFGNLSIHEMKRLNVLSYGRLYDRQLKENEVHTLDAPEVDKDGKETTKKVTPMWSKYIVIDNRMNLWQQKKKQCINCNQNMTSPITCQKCYRVKYCSAQCEKEFNDYHECIL